MSIWTVLMDDDELLEALEVSANTFLFVSVMDLWTATGEEEGDRYHADVSYVNLESVPEIERQRALGSYGLTADEADELANIALAECLHRYGLKAPLFSESGGNRRDVWRAARRSAREFLRDDGLVEVALCETVNAIGSTAAEFMAGDIFSGIGRGVHAGNPDCRIMAKMYGVGAQAIDDSRPADFLPYVMGYMAARSGGPMEADNGNIAPEYFQGYERGERVERGEVPAPSWIKGRK